MRFNAFLRDVNMDASKSSPKTCQLSVDVTLRCVCVCVCVVVKFW